MDNEICKICGKSHPTGACVDGGLDKLLGQLDRGILRQITEEAAKKDQCGPVLYGRGFELTADGRRQLELVVEIMQKALEKQKESPQWLRLQKLIEEGGDKGILMDLGFSTEHRCPRWLIDGGTSAEVKKIRRDVGTAAIEVPSDIYNLYYWDTMAESLSKIAKTSYDMQKGTMAAPLAGILRQLSRFFKETGLIDKKS